MAETPTMEVRARLTAETAQFTRGMQQATQSMNSFSEQSSRLRGAVMGIGIAAGTATAAMIAFGTKAFMAAARVDELDVSMNAVGKATGLGYQAIKDAALATKDMGIEMETASQSAIKFAQNNLDLTYASQLARAAQDLAVISGKNSTDTFNMLTHAVITGRSEVLKSVGIQKSAGQMYESFARSLGISASALTYQQKQQAVATGALAEAAKVAGVYEAAMDSPGKVLRSFARIHNEIQVAVGGVLLKAFGPMIKALYDLEKNISKAFTKSESFKNVLEALQMVFIKLTAPITAFVTKLGDAVKKFTEATTPVEKLDGALKGSQASITAMAEKFEMLLPVLASVGAAFGVMAGKQIFAMVPVLGSVMSKLSPLPVALVVLALTSTQVRNAFLNLISAFKPILPIFVQLGKIMGAVSVIAVALLAKAINFLAAVVRGSISFIQTYAGVLKTIAVVFGILAIGVAAYRAQVLILNAFTAIQTALTTAQTTATTALGIAQAKLNMIYAMNPIGVYIGLIVALITAFGYLMATNENFAKVVGKVFNFVMKIIVQGFAWIVKGIGYIIQGFGMFIRALGFVAEVVAKVFEFIIDVVLTYYQFQLKVIKFIIDAIIRLVHGFNFLLDGAKGVFFAVVDVIGKAGNKIFEIFEKIALGIGTFLGSAFDALTSWVRGLANLLGFIPGVSDMVNKALNSVRAGIVALPTKIVGLGKDTFNGIIEGAKKAIDGVAGIGAGIEKGLEKASGSVAKMIDVIQSVKDFDFARTIGNFIDGIAEKTDDAATFLIGLSASMMEFADNTDFSAAVGNGIEGFISKIKDSLKEGLGFGDILAEEKKKYNEKSNIGADADKAAEDALKAAERMKSIREAMQAGIDSIKGVLDDLRKASGEFADSLKDTIMGFAGLKSIELPDGFIPKAKSLIENMRQRLDKSNQFAQQIATLQAMGLDSGALKDIIESGPVKGAQLAASILGGGAEAIAQINSLQKAISFSGAAIGQYGADAAFGGLIGNAQTQLNRLTEAELATRTSGNNQFIQQGAFQVVVNTSGAKNTEEEIKMITDKIEQTFAILAKELAAK